MQVSLRDLALFVKDVAIQRPLTCDYPLVEGNVTRSLPGLPWFQSLQNVSPLPQSDISRLDKNPCEPRGKRRSRFAFAVHLEVSWLTAIDNHISRWRGIN